MMDLVIRALGSGLEALVDYVTQHTLTCLIPALFIAGAIAAFVKKDAVLKYFGPDVKKYISYPLASVSGVVLAVCSCTILPLFAGLYKKGSGIGPAISFLYAGPAINVLAIVYTASVLGYDLGAARAVVAILMSVVIGLIMSLLFRGDNHGSGMKAPVMALPQVKSRRPRWVIPSFFVSLVLILVIGASKLDWIIKFPIVYVLTIGIAVLLIYYFTRDEVTDWGMETWDLTKKIGPILVIGAFVVGVIAYFLPPDTFQPYLGNEGIAANILASMIGAILYMPTLLEVPIIGTTFGYEDGLMGSGPALALLLAGPAVSLPNMIVLWRIIGARKTVAYIMLVVVISSAAGFVYGNLIV